MSGSRKMCKNQFPITKWNLRWSNEICFYENDCNENSVFLWTYCDLDRTNETAESVHFIWWYFHKTIKALYYVFEFKCSKVIRIKKPGLGPCLSYKILRILQLQQQNYASDLTEPKKTIFEGGTHVILPKTEHYQALSLFLVKYSVSSACSYAVSQFCLHIYLKVCYILRSQFYSFLKSFKYHFKHLFCLEFPLFSSHEISRLFQHFCHFPSWG